MPVEITENVPLAPLTTLGLGGNARWFARCTSESDVRDALVFAQRRGLKTWVLGGGSNTLVPDAGFTGLVLHLAMARVDVAVEGDSAVVIAEAGADWDTLVAHAAEGGWSDVVCLSGIPGTVGAAPIQNIGAYGQEIAETLTRVTCLDRRSLGTRVFEHDECDFGYRTSRFKAADRDRWIVLAVELCLRRRGAPEIRYDELRTAVGGPQALAHLVPEAAALLVRDRVLELRRRKGMVLDPTDPDTQSVGSFFVNPVVDEAAYAALRDRWHAAGGSGDPPAWQTGTSVKLAAAWLVEHAGFAKGTRKAGAGVSSKHALALVNRGGTTAELLALARDIEAGVWERFGVRLEREPVLMA